MAIELPMAPEAPKVTAHSALFEPVTGAQLSVGTVPVQPVATATANTLGSVPGSRMLTGQGRANCP